MNSEFEKSQAIKILSSYSNIILEKKVINNTFEKGHQSYPIGTIHNGYKKIGEGKWRKVSSHGLTKEEHQEISNNHISQQNHHSGIGNQSMVEYHNKEAEKHQSVSERLNNNEYDDIHVLGNPKANDISRLPDEKDETIFCIKAGTVTAKNMKDNDIVQSWGDDTSYFLVEDKYIIAGSGRPEEYIGKNLTMRLVDDGNRTTKFDPGSMKQHIGPGKYKFITNKYSRPRKVTLFADNLNAFVEKLPKGQSYSMYAMK